MRKGYVVGWCLLAISLGLAWSVALGQGRQNPAEGSPHAAALQLVFSSRASQIRAIDQEDWWLDEKQREWTVKRQLGPGYFNSTHWFDVTYRIDGKEVGAWSVDTAQGNVRDVSIAK